MDASARLVENSSSLLDYVYYYQEVFNDSYSRNGSNSSLPLEDSYDAALVAALSLILGIMILITVIGNVFVIAAILLERNLQNVANYLIVSLAVADLMVACLVMPLGAVYEISGGWILGPELCDMWTSCDVLCCTASILHLVAIAVDRYWAVTNVDYIHSRTQGRIVGMIGVIWSVAVVVSLAPQLGWKDPDYLDRINLQRKCLVSQDISYQVFATCATFYVPLLVILVLYWKIFQTARKRIRRRRNRTIDQSSKSSAKSNSNRKKPDLEADKPSEATMVLVEGQSSGEVEVVDSKNVTNSTSVGGSQTTAFTISSADRGAKSTKRNQQKEGKKESLEAKRERKAAKTLAIITGAFVVCWLPFFIMALLMPLCESCSIADYLASLFLWLGYFNSTLNPVIYTIFSPEFRQAFKRILCGNVNNNRSTIRKFR